MRYKVTYWLSCPVYTVKLETDDHGMIREAAPVARWMIGKSLDAVYRMLCVRYPGQVELKPLEALQAG